MLGEILSALLGAIADSVERTNDGMEDKLNRIERERGNSLSDSQRERISSLRNEIADRRDRTSRMRDFADGASEGRFFDYGDDDDDE